MGLMSQKDDGDVGTIRPWKKSMRETVEATVGDLLGGDYWGNKTAKNLTDLADFVPVVGDAAGVMDTVDSINEEDYVGAGINGLATALGVIPMVGPAASRVVKGLKHKVKDQVKVLKGDPVPDNTWSVEEYLGGRRDGRSYRPRKDGLDLGESNKHLKQNKVAEFTAVKELPTFEGVPEPVLEKALNAFKRPDVSEENLAEAVLYNFIQEQRLSSSHAAMTEVAKTAQVSKASVEDMVLKLREEHGKDTIGYVQRRVDKYGGMYRPLDVTDVEAMKEFQKLVATESKVYKRFQRKYGDKPDVQLYKGIPDHGISEANFNPTHTGDAVTAGKADVHQELQIPLMSTTTDPNFISYQDTFSKGDSANIVEFTMPAADYKYMSLNVPAVQYDSGRLSPQESMHSSSADQRARDYDLSTTGGSTSIPTKLPHSVHLESETALSDPQNLEFYNLEDSPEKLAIYKKAEEANKRLTGKEGMVEDASPREKKRRDMLSSAINDGYSTSTDWTKLNTADRIGSMLTKASDYVMGLQYIPGPKGAMSNAMYTEVKNALKEIASTTHLTQGQGLRGSYKGKLATVFNQYTLTSLSDLASLLPKGSEKQRNIKELVDLLEQLHTEGGSARVYKRKNKEGAMPILKLTSKFNQGGLVDEVDGYTLDGGLPKAAEVDVDQGMYIDWEAGDTLTSASHETGIPVALLQEWNGGSNKVFAGGSLRIPDDFELQDTVEPATFYDKDDQDFPEYKGSVAAPVVTPSTAIEETEAMLTEAPVQSERLPLVKVDTADDEVTNAVYETIRQVENNRDTSGSGWSKVTNKWLPHASYEGGTDTIAYGHKFATQEEADAVTASGGITEAKAIELFKEDMGVAESRAKKSYEKAYPHKEWDTLGTLGKLMLTEVAFNMGTLLKDGKYNWPKLTAAIHNKDYAVASEQLSRTAPKGGKDVPLTSRTEALKEVYKSVLPKAGWANTNTQASIDRTDWANAIV